MSSSQPLVSIVTPVYNAERFLPDTIKTVQDQTYKNWELLLVDDYSTDGSVEIIKSLQKDDERIKLILQKENSGAALARNVGVKQATGRYLAFLDADDLWLSSKLEKQVEFMIKNDYAFTFTSYEFANASGAPTGKQAIAPTSIDYETALKRSAISTITVMIDLDTVKRKDIMMPNYRIGEETAVWWRLLRKYGHAHGISEVLSYYRRLDGTLSANKVEAALWRWRLYRQHEKLPLLTTVINFAHYVTYAVKRRV